MYKKPSDYKKKIKLSNGTINGYQYFYDPEHPLAMQAGSVYLHRHLASVKVGRWLKSGEFVHHDNDDRSDNSIKNLKVTTRKGHGLIHAKKRGCFEKKPRLCKVCGCEFTPRSARNEFCSIKCLGVYSRRVEHPTKDELGEDIKKLSWLAMGRKYGVSDNAVRKWAKAYGLPTKKIR